MAEWGIELHGNALAQAAEISTTAEPFVGCARQPGTPHRQAA